ncbi:hypothetical protein ACWDRM_03825 [Streptomyces cellulosae]
MTDDFAGAHDHGHFRDYGRRHGEFQAFLQREELNVSENGSLTVQDELRPRATLSASGAHRHPGQTRTPHTRGDSMDWPKPTISTNPFLAPPPSKDARRPGAPDAAQRRKKAEEQRRGQELRSAQKRREAANRRQAEAQRARQAEQVARAAAGRKRPVVFVGQSVRTVSGGLPGLGKRR